MAPHFSGKTMTCRPSKVQILAVAAWLCLLCGCSAIPAGPAGDSVHDGIVSGLPTADTVTLLFFRQANYSGGGRIHILRLDDHDIGELTADNYFRLEVWPGQYRLAVFLPAETFFGQTQPAMSIGDNVCFDAEDAGAVYVYQYTDGMGHRGFTRRRLPGPPDFLSGRSLGAHLTARDTAQVPMYFSARYDGPAVHGRPHGRGTLTWPDGASYNGVFEHGIATGKAKFHFPDGRVFMGIYTRGRPQGPGVLMTPEGRILFAGRFIDEKPHGVGLRTGKKGPEFCIFDHGRDATESFRELAGEILDRHQLEKDHLAAIERERKWCLEESALGRNLCGCAPLAPEFENWQECAAPVGERHYLP
jgi:hypothetical protein